MGLRLREEQSVCENVSFLDVELLSHRLYHQPEPSRNQIHFPPVALKCFHEFLDPRCEAWRFPLQEQSNVVPAWLYDLKPGRERLLERNRARHRLGCELSNFVSLPEISRQVVYPFA